MRQQLATAWGGFPTEPCPLEPKKLGELPRDGYRVEKILLQTRPGVWLTANAYVPETPENTRQCWACTAIGAGRQDPVVQARCIGLVRHGFFVLAVDAFGAGERGIGKALGEYHGEMIGATLFPIGLPLSGLQVYENMRTVDYLRTRPEVDGERIGITGPAAAATRRCTPALGTSDSKQSCRSVRSATISRISGPPVACARSCQVQSIHGGMGRPGGRPHRAG